MRIPVGEADPDGKAFTADPLTPRSILVHIWHWNTQRNNALFCLGITRCPCMEKGARLRVRTIFCLITKIKFGCAVRGARITSAEGDFAAGLCGSFIFCCRDPVPNGPQRAERSRGAAPDLGAPVASFTRLRGGCRNRTTASDQPAKDVV